MQPQSRFPVLSFFDSKPILEAGLDWVKPKCKPMGEEWKARMADKFWSTRYSGDLSRAVVASPAPGDRATAVAHLKELLVLRDRILTFGGEEVCLPAFEHDLTILLKHGEVWLPEGLTFRRGRPCDCHQNVYNLWRAGKAALSIATGYYLTDDGMWRQHSWCVRPTAKGGRIIETTNKALLYFGVILNSMEAHRRAGF